MLGVAAYLKETGDWSILDEPVPYDNQPGSRDAAVRAPAAQPALHARPARPARPAADRPRRLERLPEPELLLRYARPIVPDHDQQGRQGGRVGLHRRAVRAGRQGDGGTSPNLKLKARHRRPTPSAQSLPGRRSQDGGHRLAARLGRRAGSCAPTMTLASKVGSQECEEGQIFIEPQGICVMAGIGLEDGRAEQALASVQRAPGHAARHRPAAAGLSRTTTCTWARSRPTRPATRRTPASSATPTRGS